MAEPRVLELGPQDPVAGTPARRAGSVRRTTAIVSTRPDGLERPIVQRGRGRDVVTAVDGRATVVATAATDLVTDYALGMVVTALEIEPAVTGAEALVGVRATGGFRRALDHETGVERGSLPYLLLDDVPGATLVSGMALTIAAEEGRFEFATRADAGGQVPRHLPVDVCAGWQSGGVLLANLHHGLPPVVRGPDAPIVADSADPLGWVPLEPLPAYSTRRIRRLDVWHDGEVVRVEVFFRDSCTDGDAHETVVHEYAVDATVDPDTMTFLSCAAEPHVLPWLECPEAIGSADRVVGWSVAEVRPEARTQLVGISTCTHLNDVLRGLEDVGWLAALLPEPGEPSSPS